MTPTAAADLIVVGAGPAGLSAATVAARHGLQVVVVDESPQPGGRVPGQLHEHGGHWWRGPAVAAQLTDAAAAAGVQIRCGYAVWGLWPGFTVCCRSEAGETVDLHAPRVLLATGAAERALPVPGWQLPGVMTVGAAQVMVNVHRVRPGHQVLIVGIDPLGVAIARALVLAGVRVLGVVNPPPSVLTGERAVPAANLAALSAAARAAGPNPLIRLAARLVGSRSAAALALRAVPKGTVRVWGVPVRFGTAALELRGGDAVTEAVLAPVSPDGEVDETRAYRQPVDAVCLAGGLTPLAELAIAAGCEFTVVPELGGQVPLTGPDQETTVPGLWAAGNITGVESAQVAVEQGQIAGWAIARAAGACSGDAARSACDAARQRMRQLRATTGIMINPHILVGRTVLAARWSEWSGKAISLEKESTLV